MSLPRPQADNRPKEVDTSFWLWISYFALGVLGIFFTYPQTQQIRNEAMREALAKNPELDQTAFENFMTVAVNVGLALGLLFVAVLIVFVYLIRGGRNWARIVLAVIGGLGLLFGLLGLAGASGLSVLLALIQLLLLTGAIVTMFRPAANAWFRPVRPQL